MRGARCTALVTYLEMCYRLEHVCIRSSGYACIVGGQRWVVNLLLLLLLLFIEYAQCAACRYIQTMNM